MKKWMAEDWQFEVTVTDGFAEDCRLGLEKGDKFTFEYGCPADFSGAAGILRIGDAGKNMKWIWHVPVTISGFI